MTIFYSYFSSISIFKSFSIFFFQQFVQRNSAPLLMNSFCRGGDGFMAPFPGIFAKFVGEKVTIFQSYFHFISIFSLLSIVRDSLLLMNNFSKEGGELYPLPSIFAKLVGKKLTNFDSRFFLYLYF